MAEGEVATKPARHGAGKTPNFAMLQVLRTLLLLAVLGTLYAAKTLFVPIVLALLLTLLLIPAVKWLARFYVPRAVSALLLLAVIAVPFTLLGMALSEPAKKWLERLPELSQRVTEQVDSLTGAQDEVVDLVQAEESRPTLFSRLFGRDEPEPPSTDSDDDPSPVVERLSEGGAELLVYVLSATPVFFAQLVACISLTVFLLVFGSKLFDSVITNLPQIEDKPGAHSLVDAVERELSRYILAITAINAALGASVGLTLWLLGVEDAFFWGMLVGMLNFAPYVGTVLGTVMLSLAGVVQYGWEWQAAMPALVYFVLNGIEAQVVTPMVMGRHMRVNPLILMLWIFVCGWMWGFVGVLLAVPLLVCLKLIAGRVERWQHWVRIIETRY